MTSGRNGPEYAHNSVKKTGERSETQIQTEIRPLLIQFLRQHFEDVGYKDAVAKANKSFY